MRVRCGACRTQFDAPGAGRFACPVCGSVNVVRDKGAAGAQTAAGYPAGPGAPAPGAPGPGGRPPSSPPPPPPPDEPMPKIACPECEFTFIIGPATKVICPNCSAEVETGIEEADGE